MLNRLLMGMSAGAVGTAALNIATYFDMAIRGRASSDVPARTAGRIAEIAGIDLAAVAGDGPDAKRARDAAQSRRTGIGALLGYAVGLGVGTGFGALSPLLRRVPTPVAGLVLGATAMAAGDVPTAKLGASDPRTWGAPGWLADAVPHLVYGVVTVLAFRSFTRPSRLHWLDS